MCGIFAIVSKNNDTVEKTLTGLKYLEYRGYDSSGIAIINKNKIDIKRAIGKIVNLEEKIKKDTSFASDIAIGHTRWATHGKASENNAHPHKSFCENFAIVHNGIIENYDKIKKELIKQGYEFKSETDTETVVNLMSYNFAMLKNLNDAFFKTIKELEGSFAIAIIYNKEKKIFFAKKDSPLVVGIGDGFNALSSSQSALYGLTNKIIHLNDCECGILSENEMSFYTFDKKKIDKDIEEINSMEQSCDKGNFEHFMLKEIYEQPDVIERTIDEYIDIENEQILLPNFGFNLQDIDFINIVACGTSYYAGCVGKYLFENLAKIFVNVDIASEFKYRNTPLKAGGMSIFISQSGETADTISALKLCKEQGQKIVSLVNVIQSNIANLSDIIFKTVAGTEIGVASTKAFTGQISVLYLFALEIARRKQLITETEFKIRLKEFIQLPRLLEKELKNERFIKSIRDIANDLAKANNLIYCGRDLFYPLAKEGSLKIQEISYIPSQGIAGGELKHGPIALIDDDQLIIYILSKNILCGKSMSNLEEIFARNGKIIAICDEDIYTQLKAKIYKSIIVPENSNKFSTVIMSLIPLQLLAYYTALNKGLDIDKPRNLAKSVTVD